MKKLIPPCAKCPYKLGQIKTLVNPCPQCKKNGYGSFEIFSEKKKTRYSKSRLLQK